MSVFILWALLFLIVVTGLHTVIEHKGNQQLQMIDAMINVPVGISILGCCLTLIMLILQLQPASLSIPIFNHIFGVEFKFDAINAFFLFILFSCGIICFRQQKQLYRYSYSIFLYLLTAIILLAGDLYFIAYSLAFFMILNYAYVSGKSLCPLIGLVGLLGSLVIIPNALNEQKEFVLLTFNFLKTQSLPSIFILFVFFIAWSLLGFFPCSKWRVHIAKQSKGDISYSFQCLLMSIIGIYILFRFWLDIGKGNVNYVSFMSFETLAVIAAVWAGWKGVTASKFYERIHSLFILANMTIVQMIILIPVLHTVSNNEWLPFAYDGLQASLYIQFLAFSLVFLYIDDLQLLIQQKKLTTSIQIPAEILAPLLLLSFLLSGLPPFIGFVILWQNLQLLMVIPSFYQWFGILLTTFFVCMNGMVVILSILGWLRLILIGGTESLQRAIYSLQYYFFSPNDLSRKVSLVFLFILSIIPGFLFFITTDITNMLSGVVKVDHNFLTFRAANHHIAFTPSYIVLLFILIVVLIEWIVRKGRKKYPLFAQKTNTASEVKSNISKVEETSFSFGQSSFQFMLENRFPFIHSLFRLWCRLWRYWINFKIKIQTKTSMINHFLWQYQDGLLLVVIGISLLSIGLIVR